MNWAAFAEAAPELAELGRERLEARHLCLIGTLRRGGSPRISPVEPYLTAGELMIGMMPGSRKALDLLRDPRIVVHSVVTDWSGHEGDFKLYGTAIEVRDREIRLALYRAADAAHGWKPDPDQPEDPDNHIFALDIGSAAFVRFDKETWETWRWNPTDGLGLRKEVRPNT